MSETVLRLIGVTQQYGSGPTAVSALSGVDLDVAKGELVAVMGASGSGKSTLLSIAGGLATPTSGEVVIEGQHLSAQNAKQLAALRRRSLDPIDPRSQGPHAHRLGRDRRPSSRRRGCLPVEASR